MSTTGAMTERSSTPRHSVSWSTISLVRSASFSLNEHHEQNLLFDAELSLSLHSIRLGTKNCCPLTCSLTYRPGRVGRIPTLEVRIKTRAAEATRSGGAIAEGEAAVTF
jgi:hypothetical protein